MADRFDKQRCMAVFPQVFGENSGLADLFFNNAAYRPFVAGAKLYREGDRCPGAVFLVNGEIRVFKIGGSGREITLYQIFPGETCILNAVSIVTGTTYRANAEASEDGAMLYLNEHMFRKLLADYQEMKSFIFALFSQRFSEIIELVEEVTFGRLDERLFEYLVEKSENNELHTTHLRIANDLGSSREVISRLLKDFERRGTISQSRNLIRLC